MPIFLKISTIIFILSVPTLSFHPSFYNVSNALGVLNASIFLLTMFYFKKHLIIPRESLLFTAWLIIAGASSLLTAYDLKASLIMMSTLLQIGLLFIILFNLCIWDRGIDIILISLILSAVVNCGFVGNVDDELRAIGLVENANMFGYTMVLGMFSVLTLVLIRIQTLGTARLVDWILIALSICLSYGLIMSGSKKALVGLLFILLAVPCALCFTLRKNISKALFSAALMACLALLLMHALSQSSILARTQESLNFFLQQERKARIASDSTSLRYAYLIAGIEMFLDNPVFGIGLDNFETNIERFSTKFGLKTTYSHCNYVEILASTGLLGFLIYFGIYLSIFHRVYRRWRTGKMQGWIIPIAVSFFYLMLNDLASVSYYDKISSIWLSAIVASFSLEAKRNTGSTAATG